jgi:SAM-dependent methyltransferase
MTELKATNSFEVYSETTREEMLRFIPRNAKMVLDVGCSVGNFGKLLKSQHGSKVWGVEVDPASAQLAGAKLDHVYNAAFSPSMGLPENFFDCIVFNDVLEHMIDPYTALRYAKKLLTRDGVVVASIPNVRYFGNMWLLLVHGLWEYQDTGILDRTHLRFFTKRSIHSTFKRLGYRIDVFEGINPVEKFEPFFRRKFEILNLLFLGGISDMRWVQFAIVARPADINAKE